MDHWRWLAWNPHGQHQGDRPTLTVYPDPQASIPYHDDTHPLRVPFPFACTPLASPPYLPTFPLPYGGHTPPLVARKGDRWEILSIFANLWLAVHTHPSPDSEPFAPALALAPGTLVPVVVVMANLVAATGTTIFHK